MVPDVIDNRAACAPRGAPPAFTMYSTCLFCTADLGRNEVIEQFPVGRRLAFDPARGRLWVVCPHCRRWNLTPLEERWEAIEDAERRFRETRLRVSTGQIGLARLREGLELVRVGEPLRPEIAAWRYGEQFSRRRRKQLVTGAAIVAGGGLLAIGSLAGGVGVVTTYSITRTIWSFAEHGFPGSVVARIRLDADALITVRRRDLSRSTLHMGDDGGIAMRLVHARGERLVVGDDARRVARKIFPGINRRGGTPADVQRAVARLEHAGDAERFLSDTARRGERLTKMLSGKEIGSYENPEAARNTSGLLALSTSLGLAIEMALNEKSERLALDGELAELESAWREAEEIGAIADSLFLPEAVERAWQRLKGDARM
jgi:hypothetical protein